MHYAQQHSKVSEWLCRRLVQIVQNVCKTEKHCVQQHSKVSEWLCRRLVQIVQNVCKNEKHYAQQHSKVSEWAVQNGFVVVPSVPDGGSEPLSRSATPETFCTSCVQIVQNVCKTEKHCAQQHSKVSEWLCKRLVQIVQNVCKTEKHYAQQHSRVSEWFCKRLVQIVQNVCKTEKHYAQQHSRVSELAVQNRTVVRFFMLAMAKMSKEDVSRGGAENCGDKIRMVMLNSTPKYVRQAKLM